MPEYHPQVWRSSHAVEGDGEEGEERSCFLRIASMAVWVGCCVASGVHRVINVLGAGCDEPSCVNMEGNMMNK